MWTQKHRFIIFEVGGKYYITNGKTKLIGFDYLYSAVIFVKKYL